MALVVLCGASFYVYKTNNVNETYENKENKEVNNNMLSMMLEKSAGSGEYQETTANEWPTEGYVFNENLSKCEKGSNLSWDSTKNTVVMTGNNSDKCYVYFDVYVPPAINEVCSNGDTMSNCIKKLYTKQGENNLYLHDSSLTNGAKDNSYRYAGSSETTNNFVCFGYDSMDGSCSTDYLYRIIGVFDNQAKLIKYDYAKSTLLGTDGDYGKTYQASGNKGTNKGQNSTSEIGGYYWHYLNNGLSYLNIWSESELNIINLNKNYINNIGTKWSEKISDHTWKAGEVSWDRIAEQTALNAYQNEINNSDSSETVNAKVGLMYASDYGYAVSSNSWSITLNNYNENIADNWMYMGLYEWILTPQEIPNAAFSVYNTGSVNSLEVNRYQCGVRPVFYLKSIVGYAGGSGTISSPILLK